MKIINYIFKIIILLIAFESYSQQLRFKQITNEEGLSTNYVTAVIQDDLGFMWFGTQDGLNKYDGHNFTVYKNDPTNLNSISNSEITCLSKIRQDLILIGTRSGLNLYNPILDKFTRLKGRIGVNLKINSISLQNADNVFVGTDEGVFLVSLSTGNFIKYNFPQDTLVVVNCLKSIKGKVYVGTKGKGIWAVNGNKLEKVSVLIPENLKINSTELESISYLENSGNKIFAGTSGYGIFIIDNSTFKVQEKIVFNTSKYALLNFINGFVIKENKLFAATDFGLVNYDLTKHQILGTENKESANKFGLNDNVIKTLFIDEQDNIWLGSQVGGVNVSFIRSIKFPDVVNNKQHDFKNLYCFHETSNNERIIGGENLLVFFNANKSVTDYSKILNQNSALCIFQESRDVFWIGTWGIGIIRFDRATNQTKTILSSKLGGTVLCLKPDGNGNLYAGTFGDGLFKINLKNFEVEQFGINEGLSCLNINTLFTDSKNNLWIGMYDGGLQKFKGYPLGRKLNVLSNYTNTGRIDDIASNIVFGINESKNGEIWVATSAGLSKLLSNNKFHNFYEKDGLSNVYLYSILEDKAKNFWMSSNNGIIKFDPNVKLNEISFKNYGIKDGLINTEYNIGSAFISKNGTIYFGGANGYNVFEPNDIKDNLYSPKTFIVGYKRAGKNVELDSSISYKKNLKLKWRENYFQFEVTAIDFTDPSKIKFKYKLDGYDEDWSAPTNVRYISYTELPGGEYKLLIKATNNDGIWNNTPFEIKIEVVPPFWKTKWFYFLVMLVAIIGIYLFTQYRTNAIKKENKILENKVAERTKQLEEKNKDITSSIEYAKRIQEAILPSKEQIFKKFKNLFIFYQPKDIVSGDFYWFGEKNGVKILAVVDCTGHGVPGAFMSMIGHNLLHQIVSEKAITDPGEILNNLHKGVQEALRQGKNEIDTNDGMDVSLIAINSQLNEIKWAGANRPIVTIDADGNFIKYDGNKYPVGGAQLDDNRMFTTHNLIKVNKTMAYMSSDGYADQFGGDKGKKFMVKRYYDLIKKIYLFPPEEQKTVLVNNFIDWKNDHEQVDDVLVVGLEI